MIKQIISELLYLILASISALFILAFLMLLTFAGRLDNKFLKVLIIKNFIDNPYQGILALTFILAFIITFVRQKKLNLNNYIANYILIFTGFGVLYFFSRFIYNAQRMKEIIMSEIIFNAQRMNVTIKSDQYTTNFRHYNYEIILLSSLVLIVGFITIKTILKTKEMHNTFTK